MSCLCCFGQVPSKGTIIPLEMAAKPWERIHIDFFEKGKLNFLIVVDAYSKSLEVIPMGSTTSLKTIEVLRSLFACYGMPEEVVLDNRPQLASEVFSQFLKQRMEPSLRGFHRTILHLVELLNVLYRPPRQF